MGLFSNKDGGIMDVIRCDEADYLIWKWHPKGISTQDSQKANSIRWGSSLRVRDGSVAVFVYPQEDGTLIDYIEGPYDEIIETKNFPVLSTLVGKFYNNGSPFQAEIYFINLANLIQIQFGVPYFDVFDPDYINYAVPIAVRGSINFQIADYREFIRLHSLRQFDMPQFKAQIKNAITRHVKTTVTNAPEQYDIPVLQMERQLAQINALVEKEIRTVLRENYGVSVTSVDISDIEIDKESSGYKKLQAHTQNKANTLVQSAKNLSRTMGFHNKGAKKHDNTSDDNNRTGDLKIGIVGKLMTGAVNNALGNLKKAGNTPPPLPTIEYYVAIDGQQSGPFETKELISLIRDGVITPDSLVWKKGMKNWVKADSVKELERLFENVESSIPPALPENEEM